jgi:hypothetical protein
LALPPLARTTSKDSAHVARTVKTALGLDIANVCGAEPALGAATTNPPVQPGQQFSIVLGHPAASLSTDPTGGAGGAGLTTGGSNGSHKDAATRRRQLDATGEGRPA